MPDVEFQRSLLSERENEILDLAADGLTDVQIALRLTIRPSTVNSYWVRIRSKLGHRSRTELVAMSLRKEAKDEQAKLILRAQEFERLAFEREELSEAEQYASLLRTGLQALPDAVALVAENGVIHFANDRFAKLFGYERDELCGLRATTLIGPHDRASARKLWAEILGSPDVKVIGYDKAIYARRKDRSTFLACGRFGKRGLSNGWVVASVIWPAVDIQK